MTLNPKNYARFRPHKIDAFVHYICFGIDFTKTY